MAIAGLRSRLEQIGVRPFDSGCMRGTKSPSHVAAVISGRLVFGGEVDRVVDEPERNAVAWEISQGDDLRVNNIVFAIFAH